MKNLASALTGLFLLSSTSFAQHALLQVTNPMDPGPNSGGFASRGSFAGDLDQDGYDDFVVTLPVGTGSASRVQAYSGRTGAVLWQDTDPTGSVGVGGVSLVSIGRSDNDPIPDILASTSSSSSHRVLSGATGAILHEGTLHPGSSPTLSAAGNIDGDGFGDYLLSYAVDAFGTDPELTNGRLYVMSGATHQVIRTHAGSTPFSEFTTITLGDVNGDGRDDYVILHDCAFTFCNPSYDIHSGLDGSILSTEATSSSAVFSVSYISPLGDFDGDGASDFQWVVRGTLDGGPDYVNLANRFVSGATGLSLPISPGAFFYGILGPVGDLNSDGSEEVLATRARGFTNSGITILDLTSMTELWFVRSELNWPVPFGAKRIGDTNADGAFDVMVRASEHSSSGSTIRTPSRVVIYSGSLESPSESFCFSGHGTSAGCSRCPCPHNSSTSAAAGCSNSEGFGAILRVRGEVSLTNDRVQFELNRGPRLSFALLASGNTQLPQQGPCAPGTGISGTLSNGLRCIGGDFRRHGTRSIDVAGNSGLSNAGWGATAGMNGDLLGQSGVALGQSRYFQAFYRDAVVGGCGTGVNTTNAIALTPQP